MSTGTQIHTWDLRNLKYLIKTTQQPYSALSSMMIPNANLLTSNIDSLFLACNDVLITRNVKSIIDNDSGISDKYLVHDSEITGVACLSDKVLATGTLCGTINLWNDGIDKSFHDMPSVTDLTAYDENKIVCCDDFGHVVILNKDLEIVGEINNTHTSYINSIAGFRKNIFTASGDSTIKFWKPF